MSVGGIRLIWNEKARCYSPANSTTVSWVEKQNNKVFSEAKLSIKVAVTADEVTFEQEFQLQVIRDNNIQCFHKEELTLGRKMTIDDYSKAMRELILKHPRQSTDSIPIARKSSNLSFSDIQFTSGKSYVCVLGHNSDSCSSFSSFSLHSDSDTSLRSDSGLFMKS